MSSAASNSYYAAGGWTMEYVTGDPARITIEGNVLKQQTAPHNHAVDVVQYPAYKLDKFAISLRHNFIPERLIELIASIKQLTYSSFITNMSKHDTRM